TKSPGRASAKEVKSSFRMAYRASPERSTRQGSLPSLDFFRPSGSYLPHPTYFERIDAVDLHDVDLASAKWRMPLGRTIFRTHRRNRTPVSAGAPETGAENPADKSIHFRPKEPKEPLTICCLSVLLRWR